MTTLVVRSLMFVPGGRPELLDKVARSRPDVVVVDLEDAVAPPEKATARAAASAALLAARPGARTVLIRVNPPGTPWYADDLAAAAASPVDGVVLPKYEHPEQLAAVREALPAGSCVVVGIETVLGVVEARALLAAGPDGAYFGAEDLVADLGGRRTEGGAEIAHARAAFRFAAHLTGVPAIDQAVVAVRDTERFRLDAEQARDLGFHGKICLHPLQVELAHAVFTPGAEEIAQAHAVIAAAAAGVGVVDGRMVDAVHVTMAREVLARAGH